MQNSVKFPFKLLASFFYYLNTVSFSALTARQMANGDSLLPAARRGSLLALYNKEIPLPEHKCTMLFIGLFRCLDEFCIFQKRFNYMCNSMSKCCVGFTF